MIIVESQNKIPVRLTTERWAHIIDRHPEMASLRDRVLETVGMPDYIQAGDFGELLAVRFYPQTPLTQKYLIVAYREVAENDGFILTAFLARRPSAGRKIVWKP
jgi:hypothetical protein